MTTPAPAAAPKPLAAAIPDAVAILVIGVFALQGLLTATEALLAISSVLLGRAIPRPGGGAGAGGATSGVLTLVMLPLAIAGRR